MGIVKSRYGKTINYKIIRTVKSSSGRAFNIVSETITDKNNKSNCEMFIEHNRDCDKNIKDIACSAALAFHKSIIGISELYFLESSLPNCNKFRSAIAVQTYYVVYHLFCGCMLLDNSFRIKINYLKENSLDKFEGLGDLDFLKKIHFSYEIDEKKLNSELEDATTWKKGKKNEMDMATAITHGEIKDYCENLRRNPTHVKKHPYLEILYKAFVNERSKNVGNRMLFERLDYIRDRSIYRPSVVVLEYEAMANGVQKEVDDSLSSAESWPEYAQTSKDVRKEIDSLPSSDELYDVIKRILSSVREEKHDILAKEFVGKFSLGGFLIHCDDAHLAEVGYKWEQAEELGGSKAEEYVPSFAYQLMELFDPKDAIDVYNKYWKSLTGFDYIKQS